MQRRILLTALIVAIMLAILISAAALAKKNAGPTVVAGTQTCTYGDKSYDWTGSRLLLTDSVFTCALVAYNNEAMGTGIQVVHMNADFDSTYTGFVWGSYTITTTEGGIWQGTFNGYNSQYALEGYTPDPPPAVHRQEDLGGTVIIGHTDGQGRLYKGYSMSESVRVWDTAWDPSLGVFVMEITKGK
jgi:hypothetical protein